MKQFSHTVKDPLGIHTHLAGLLAQQAKTFNDTTVAITKGDTTVKTAQFMQLIRLGVKRGDVITFSADGANEDAAIQAMSDFCKKNL